MENINYHTIIFSSFFICHPTFRFLIHLIVSLVIIACGFSIVFVTPVFLLFSCYDSDDKSDKLVRSGNR